MFRTPSLGDSISVALRKLLQGGRSRGVRPYITLQQREQAVWTSKIRCQVKQFCILCMERCKPLGPLNSLLSYATQLSGTKFCFLVHLKEWQMAASCNPQLLSNHCGGWQHLLDHSLGSPHSHLETRNRWWLWHFLFIDMAGDIFIPQTSFPVSRNRSQLTGWDWA